MVLYIRSKTYEKENVLGIVTLIILLLGVTAVLLLRDTDTEPEVIYKTDVEPARKTETPITEKPTARPGYKIVKHDDHWHEVPIDASDEWQEGTPEPNVPKEQSKQAPKTFTGKLTFHAELLKTNPVKALRLQAEERGHWSAKWIPPFPADDHEASELASVVYTIVYNRHASLEESPEQDILAERSMCLIREYNTRYPPRSDDIQVRARNYDLTKLAWVILPYDDDDDDLRSELPSQFTVARRTQ